jgi:CRP-like cAMP-binding protein
MENIKFLKGIEIFKHLSSLDLIELSKFIKRRFYSKGEMIIREDSLCNTFYMIKSGTVMVSRRGEKKDDTPIAKLNPGRYFGELSLLDYHPVPASVLAYEDVETFELKKEDFDIFVDRNKDIAVKIYRTIGKILFEKLKYSDVGLITDFDI